MDSSTVSVADKDQDVWTTETHVTDEKGLGTTESPADSGVDVPLVVMAENAGKETIAKNQTLGDAEVSDYFQQNRQFWKEEPVQFNGNKVYQRDDLINPNRLDPKSGKTNLELMQAGRAPIGPDGKSVNLHHLTQKQDGAIAEVTQVLHSNNHGTLHMPNSIPSGINRSEFNKWRRNYWKARAKDFEGN